MGRLAWISQVGAMSSLCPYKRKRGQECLTEEQTGRREQRSERCRYQEIHAASRNPGKARKQVFPLATLKALEPVEPRLEFSEADFRLVTTRTVR